MALSLYLRAQDKVLPAAERAAAERAAALKGAFEQLQELCREEPAHLRLSSLARVARDYGFREVAARALDEQAKALARLPGIDFSEPFLAPGHRFDTLPPKPGLREWIFAGLIKELELCASWSSYYNAAASARRLSLIYQLGLGSAQMMRHRQLVAQVFGHRI